MRRWLFWEFPRATWQYDVMVGLILAFIFLTPRGLFRDQPRVSSVVMLPSERGSLVFWVSPDAFDDVPEAEKQSKAKVLLRPYSDQTLKDIQITTIYNAEEEIKGYMVSASR